MVTHDDDYNDQQVEEMVYEPENGTSINDAEFEQHNTYVNVVRYLIATLRGGKD